MELITKLACAVAITMVTLAKLPFSIIGGFCSFVEAGLLTINLDLAEMLDCEWWTEGLREVMDWNIQKAYSLAESMEDLKEGLD